MSRFEGKLLLGIALLGAAGCENSAPSGSDSVDVKTSAIIGGDSHEVTTVQTLPARGVGWIAIDSLPGQPAGGFCSATPIARDVVLTAGHCLCVNNGEPGNLVTFHLQHLDPATGMIVDVGPLVNGVKQGIVSRAWHFQTFVCDPASSHEPSKSAEDLAIVELSSALSFDDLPQLPQVYTLGDFLDRIKNLPPSTTFFSPPIEAIGWDGSIPDNPLKKLATVDNLAFSHETVFSFTDIITFGIANSDSVGWWIHDDIDTVQRAGSLSLEEGDSGGPITFRQNTTTPMIFGVHSLNFNTTRSDFGFVAHFNAWSPTWDNDQPNGAFIRQFTVDNDADGDGVTDDIDNCTPPRCNSMGTCFNPDQADADGDGIGDRCDNCPPSLCGANPTFCANRGQEDRDGDHLGDVCDVCPSFPVSRADVDQDRIGDACDNCPTSPGGRRACKIDTDCGGHGFCIKPDTLGGRCNDGTNRTCNTFLTSTCSSCVEVGMWGVCSESEEPDTDGDGIGNRCDTCPLVPDANLQLNSNRPAEQREFAVALNDACDSTPLFTARPAIESTVTQQTLNRTLFTAYAGVGTDTSVPRAAFVGAQVGFRQCNCRNISGAMDIPFNNCLLTTCGNARAHFNQLNDVSWKPVTVGAAPPGVFIESQVATPTLDSRLDPTYTDTIDCADPLPHPLGPSPDEVGKCRLGTGRLLSWSVSDDITAGRVVSFVKPFDILSGEPAPDPDNPVLQTTGLFWSHGLVPTPFVSAGARDSTFAGNLRDHYVYVKTPSVSTDTPPINRLPILATACALGCYNVLPTDWLIRTISPGIGMNLFRLLLRPFAIVPAANGTLVGVRRSSDPNIDLSLALSAPARLTLADTSRSLVSPVEPFPKDPSLGIGIAALSIPKSWLQLNSDIEALGNGVGGTLDVVSVFATAGPGLPENVTPFGGVGFVPSDRDGARSIFSKLEQSLYLVGGAHNGIPTKEIWRLDLSTAEWTHLFALGSQVRPRNVSAVAYDSALGKLIVADDSPGSSPSNARLIVFDTYGNTSHVAALANLSSFAKVGLTATGNGTFVLVGATQSSWTAYRFQVSASNHITWLGKTSGQGLVVADPVAWEEGPGLLVKTGQDLNPVDLPPSAFTPSGTPPELAVCDHPPIVGQLPAVTISSCHLPSLLPPALSSACGPVAFDLSAPATFALGSTVVTWTFTDALGNVVTAPQTVTAVLGDDPTCCPAGTHVIVGTSNNDNITGTAGADCILGLGGQDTISGGGGDDYISGGDGNDVIDGGSGNDHIWGGSGQDQITGGIGNDIIDGGDGDDICHGGDGDDVIHGGNGQDQIFGENGNDQLFGDAGDDTLDGGAGNDALNGGGLHDVCIGGTGTNTFAMCMTIR